MASIAHSIQNPPSDVSPPLKEVALAFAVVRSKPPLVLIRGVSCLQHAVIIVDL